MHKISRRELLGLLGGGMAAAPMVSRGRFQVFAQSTSEYSARTVRLMEETTVVDLLNQFRFPDLTAKRPAAWAGAPFYDNWFYQPGSFTGEDAAAYRASGIDVFAIGSGAADYTAGL